MAELWLAIVPADRARADADFLVDRLGLRAGQCVLDMPCGEGRVAIELAGRGLAVTGIDISGELLAAARQRATQRGARVAFVQGDMRDPPRGGPFDAAFCWGDSLGYLDDADNVAFLRTVNRMLVRGGSLALEIQMLEPLLARHFSAHQCGEVAGL